MNSVSTVGCSAVVLLAADVVLPSTASADPGQDERFLALLAQERFPAVQNIPELIESAHRVCTKLDGGMSAEVLIADTAGKSYGTRPAPPELIHQAVENFVTAAVTVYCPDDLGKISS